MMTANSYSEITADMDRGCQMAADRLGVSVHDVRGYFLAGGDWDADTSEELADEIVRCWAEQAAYGTCTDCDRPAAEPAPYNQCAAHKLPY